MLFTNSTKHGGTFKKQFLHKLKKAKSLNIATGYFGVSLIEDLKSKIMSISKKGQCRILLGMIFHDGISFSQKQILEEIDNKLRNINPNNGIYISRKDYHGKIYKIDNEIYVGSSNFSASGFHSRWECTVKVNNTLRNRTERYLEFLFSRDSTVKLDQVELRIKGRKKEKPSKSFKLQEVKKLPSTKILGEMKIKLRVNQQPASSLNLFFDKGRKNPNGLYAPRAWYEVEITARSKETQNKYYPESTLLKPDKKSKRGEFDAYIEENGKIYKIPMVVTSDNGKAIMSRAEAGGREVLGRYIKGKLESAGVLKFGERITQTTLEEYGNDSITLKKLKGKNYILEFGIKEKL